MKVSLRHVYVQTMEDCFSTHFIFAFDNFLHILSILPAGTIELNE